YGPTPTVSVDTVPPTSPGGVLPATTIPGGVLPATTTPGGVSPAGALPVTGSPLSTVATIGGLLIAAGAASVWYTRRRRSA
ncbi:MAG TPA: LPXTG cell wall anchor domain-containing protein, partial [Actinoplanes sp.]|nr:LPXTG cell wall anchor domain-containing protein [Actinoplanes sp.]